MRGVYKHIKTGNLYEVIAKDIINCTNGFEETTLVLYQKFNLVNKNIPNEIFARETKEFKEKFKVNTNQYGIKSCVCGYKDSVSFSINVLQKGQINIMHFTCPDCGKIGSYKRPALEEILV